MIGSHSGRIALQAAIDLLLEKRKELGIADGAVLDYFRQAIAPMPRGQRFQNRRINPDQLWMIKRTDQIFAFGDIYARFPADRSVYLRQECGRNLNIRNASQIRRRDKSRQISNHAAAQRNEP